MNASPRPSAQSAYFPAPSGGLNTIDPAGMMSKSDAPFLVNLISAEMGMRARLGSREWITGMTGAVDNRVRSIMPFNGSAKNGTKDKLFATTSTGIWGASASTAAPTQLIAFPTQTGEAGIGVSWVFVNSAGHFLIYCDEENGLYVYTESTNAWAKIALGGGATDISVGDPTKFVAGTVFKGRIWFVEKDSAKSWYMGTNALYGAATQFDFGTKFKAGGDLRGLWNWTIDGGSGIDDSLVGISGGGDVVIYQGTDPATFGAFGLQGVWYIGAPPYGRKVATGHGGDVLIVTRLGILPLSRLTTNAAQSQQYLSYKIGNRFSTLTASQYTLLGWSIALHPEDNALLVTVPTTTGSATVQLAMSLANGAWADYSGLPIYSSGTWNGLLYYGTVDGRVCINTGYLDGVTLADPSSYSEVQWAALHAFQNLGNGLQKQVLGITPTVISDGGSPAFFPEARYRYDLAEVSNVPSNPNPGTSNVWDTGKWDAAKWAGSFSTTQSVRGAVGMGREFSVAIRGTARSRTVYVGSDVTYRVGGML